MNDFLFAERVMDAIGFVNPDINVSKHTGADKFVGVGILFKTKFCNENSLTFPVIIL